MGGDEHMVRNLKNNKSGFTLVELLVAVAIVGVLTTAGIPQYRRMVQKAKKSEAKVALGDISNAEQAFYSEFGAYGTNLAAMGVEMLNGAQRIYISGFTGATCATSEATALPAQAGTVGVQLNLQNPQYYTGYGGGTNTTRFGRMTRTTVCAASNATTDTTFQAASSGVIQSGGDLDTGANAAKIDQWTMNEGRILANPVDGIN